jgi:hypothetical protein
MCTVLLPSGDNPNAVNKYIISYLVLEITVTCTQVRSVLSNLTKERLLAVTTWERTRDSWVLSRKMYVKTLKKYSRFSIIYFDNVKYNMSNIRSR